MKFLLAMIMVVLSSCASKDMLHVDLFHLNDNRVENHDTPMVRGEERKRLHGAISTKEQLGRLGFYYTASWNDPGLEVESGILKFEYLQQITGAEVQRMQHKIEQGSSKGSVDFKIIGDDYRKRGRVLAWRMTYWRAGEKLASEQSYLWE